MLHLSFHQNKKGTIGVLIVGIVCTIIGGVMAYVGFDTYRDGQETESWTATSGRVLSSTIDESTRTTRRNGRTETKTTYTPEVTYEYTVDGVRYEGDSIRADDHGGGSDRAYDLAGRYPEGSETTVYYDPESPADAVLMRGYETTQVYLFGGIGGLFGIIGLGMLGFIGVMLRRMTRAGSSYPEPAFTTA